MSAFTPTAFTLHRQVNIKRPDGSYAKEWRRVARGTGRLYRRRQGYDRNVAAPGTVTEVTQWVLSFAAPDVTEQGRIVSVLIGDRIRVAGSRYSVRDIREYGNGIQCDLTTLTPTEWPESEACGD